MRGNEASNLAHLTRQDYKIKRGDIIKLGRVKFKVKEFWTENEVYSEADSLAEGDDAIPIQRCPPDANEMCRICWVSEEEDHNPLIAPCKCDGTVKYVHLNCLKEWLQSKVTERTPANLHSFMWKTFECDLCKLPFPYVLRIDTARYNLVNIKRPAPEEIGRVAYLILESLGLDKNSSRMVHTMMVNLADVTSQEGSPQFKMVSGSILTL